MHRRIKPREIFDLAESAYLGLRRAAHRAEAAADAAAVVDSDDDTDDDGALPPPPRQQPASETTSNELNGPGRGVCPSGAGFGRYNPPPEPEPPPNAAAEASAAPATAPARVTRSGAASKPHEDVLASHRAAVAPVATSAAIAATDVGQPGAGFGYYIPSPALELPPGAAASVAGAAAMFATVPARVPRADAEREQPKSVLASYHSGNAISTTSITRQTEPLWLSA